MRGEKVICHSGWIQTGGLANSRRVLNALLPLDPFAQGGIHAGLPALAGGAEISQNVRRYADRHKRLDWFFLWVTTPPFHQLLPEFLVGMADESLIPVLRLGAGLSSSQWRTKNRCAVREINRVLAPIFLAFLLIPSDHNLIVLTLE